MIKRILKNKLVALGYAATYVENKMKEISIPIDTGKYTESELIQKIKVMVFEKPTAEIPRFFLNIDGKLISKFLFEGNVNTFTKFSIIGSQISLLDYPLSEKLCMIGITEDLDIMILLYIPSRDTMNRFIRKTYEDIYGEERENIVGDYIDALTSGNRLSSGRAKDVVYVLLSEFIFDTIMIENSNPKLKLCDSAPKFAENITNYEFKYINRRINRIEYVEKYIEPRFIGYGLELGNISNDPYMLLKEVNHYPEFSLNRPTYAWLKQKNRGQEEIVIYTANEYYQQNTYREFMLNKEDVELRQEADKLVMQFSNEVGYQISRDYIFGVLKKLNRQLIISPIDFIRLYTAESYEYIEPLKYRFSVIKNRRDFESFLYNTIDDNLNGRYRYRFVEKLSGIYTTIGNKLNYTDQNGKVIRKQSVADFNINFNAAVIKRETLIDGRSIPQLLGYMYKDLDYVGRDMLPVPSIEVVFYFPDINVMSQDVEMYNGTSIDIAKGDGIIAYYEIGVNSIQQTRAIRPKDPNEKYIVVKYTNSEGEILKENIIRDAVVGSTYIPEVIPIINDREGKEWICLPNQILSLNVSADNSRNEIEIKYTRKMSRVRINYINKQGTELNPPVIKNMQVGEIFDMESVRKFVDSTKVEWSLYQSKPARFSISDDESANVLTLVYDVVKADIYIYYQTRDGREIKPSEKTVAVAGKDFAPEIIPRIIEPNGLVWQYAPDSKSIIYVQESELNTVVFMYDELKKRVVTQFVDEDGIKIKDDIVEIAQVGNIYEVNYEELLVDIYNKHWQFKSINKPSINVSENEAENVCVVVYEKLMSKIIISMVNQTGQRVKDDLIEKAQIGAKYIPTAIKEIEDNYGLGWVCVDDNKSLVVEESEVKNRITYQYKPFMTKVCVQYVDIEGNELLPPKQKEVQVGSVFVPDFISTLQGKDQRSWVLSPSNPKQFKAKKHEEENIIKINYDKNLVNIKLGFYDIHGNVLKEEIDAKAQLGSEFKVGKYERITSDNGERWMNVKTEPAKMFVRENSQFKLIYDEIKAKVVVKCINISDSKSIVNDIEIITKLGGVFVPNIQAKIVDKLKRRWAYVGEPGMSLVTKENEQENIILLKYEPDRANVILRYLNKNQQKVHEDVINAEQIGAEISIKEYDKVFEEDGMGWKLKNMTRQSLIVNEDEDKNIVISNYEPLMVPVTTRYINEDAKELTTSKVENIQVGETFNAVILPKVNDSEGKTWIYSNIKTVELKVKDEENNKVNIKYVPLMKNVTEKFVNLQNEKLNDEKIKSVQVGSTYTLKRQERVIDSEDKSWIYQKSTVEKIKVLEEEEKNVIINYYDKELTQVVIRYQTTEGVILDKDKILDLQIGSIYTIEPKETLDDDDKLTWIVSKENKLKVKISREPKENIFIVEYERYMVNVYDKYINEKTNQEIIKPTVTKHQVGSSYLVKVKESIIDDEGKHWVQAAKSEIKIFTSNYKVEPITVVRDASRNVTIVKYKPKLADTTIKYQDPLGNSIKVEETKKIQVGSIFSENIPATLVDSYGNKWSYNPNSNSDVRISEDPNENFVVLAYEEFKGTVTIKYLDNAKNELQAASHKLVQIGNVYEPSPDMIVTDENGCVWEYVERDREKFEVKENEKENIVELIYQPLNVDVEITLVDLWDNEITKKKIVPAQLGSNFKPSMKSDYTNEKSLLYRLKKTEPESIVIKEIPIGAENNPNQFKLKFEPINSNVTIICQDLDGNILKNEEKIQLQVGSKYKPEPSEYIKDKKGNEWQLVTSKKDEITVLDNEESNIIKYVYEVAKADIIIRYINVDGLSIMPENRESKQVGSEYIPAPELHLLDRENKKWKLLNVSPVNLRVGSINNIITVTYQEEKTKVIWRYCDEKGNILKPEEKHDVQIGTRYTPIVKDKVIYDAGQIWRLLKIEPYEIIISENQAENIVNLIYSDTKVEEKVEEKKELVNPFANTLTAEEEKQVNNMISNNVFDTTDVSKLKGNKDTVIFQTTYKNGAEKAVDTSTNNLNSNDYQDNIVEEKVFEFEDPDLSRLARSMSLTNTEKMAINELNNINAQIVDEFRKSKSAYYAGQKNYDYTNIEKLIIKEKEMIKNNLDKFSSQDISGARMLKILEHIVASEKDDKTFGKLQQRKAVLLTDYFLDKSLEDMDKTLYICERGKNNIELELIESKLNLKLKNPEEAQELKTILHYERILLENYYKARNNSNDNYFKDTNIKSTTMPEIVVGVTNLLVKQAIAIFRKPEIDFALQNEVEAILLLCTPQQINTIKTEIEKLDGKQKRNANKIIQDLRK